MSKVKAPAYQWYPRDFAADEPVILMTLEEEGAYRRLLDHQWLHGSIPDDIKALATICKGVSVARMKSIWAAVGPCFMPADQPGRLVNQRLERARVDLDEFREDRRINGKLGADRRWGKGQSGSQGDSSAMPLAIAQPPQQPIATDGSASATASATASAGEKETALLRWTADFDLAWAAYPKRPNNSRGKASKAYMARRREGVSAEVILAGVVAYAAYVQAIGQPPHFVKLASTFFGPDEHWLTDYAVPESDPLAGAPPEVRACIQPNGKVRLWEDLPDGETRPTAAMQWLAGRDASGKKVA